MDRRGRSAALDIAKFLNRRSNFAKLSALARLVVKPFCDGLSRSRRRRHVDLPSFLRQVMPQPGSTPPGPGRLAEVEGGAEVEGMTHCPEFRSDGKGRYDLTRAS